MASVRWTHTTSKVEHALSYRFGWFVKYSRPVLTGDVRVSFLEHMRDKCLELGASLLSVVVLEDRVIIDIAAGPTICPHWLLTQIRHYTSRKLRAQYPELKTRIPALWTRAYFCKTLEEPGGGPDIDKFFERHKGE